MVENKQYLLDLLKKGLSRLDIKSAPQCEERVFVYIDELLDWSQRINLTTIKVPEDMIVKHFLDSLVCLKEIGPVMAEAPKVLDIGTGAGFPGLPLKIFCRDLSVSLMEATGKKIRFLEELLRKLGISDVPILHGRAEGLSKEKELREKFDFVVIRAVGELKLLAQYSFPFLKNGGCLLALKGMDIEAEAAQSRAVLKKMRGSIEKISDYELISGKNGKLVKIVKGSVNG